MTALPAHPRACGENTIADQLLHLLVGSSPRMRGKPLFQIFALAEPRLIPAHAGKTVIVRSVSVRSPAHPRACGENIAIGD